MESTGLYGYPEYRNKLLLHLLRESWRKLSQFTAEGDVLNHTCYVSLAIFEDDIMSYSVLI